MLSVIRDMGMKEPYVGQTQLHSGEIAEDLTYYYASSEQVSSSVALGVLVDPEGKVEQAGGFILQLMPFAEDRIIDKLEQNIVKLPQLTGLLKEGKKPEDIAAMLTEGMDLEINDRMPVEYRCNCSRERMEKALISIGKKELQSMIDDGEPIEMVCHFCGNKYTFGTDELKDMLAAAENGPAVSEE